jgi:hypothetical protein
MREVSELVELLSEKDNKIRYEAFLLLQQRSMEFDDVYAYWDKFCEKLNSENSYQRSIDIMLIAENVRWDSDDKFDKIVDEYLLHLNDEKPITVRQCIQSLQKIVPFKRQLSFVIADKLIAIDILSFKETMQKPILLDILEVLILIRKNQTNDEIEGYIVKSLSGGILDKKSIGKIRAII